MLWWLCLWLQRHWSVTGWKRLIYNTATSCVYVCVCVCLFVCVCVCEKEGRKTEGSCVKASLFSCIYVRVTDRSVWIGVTTMCPHCWGYSCQLLVRWCCFYVHTIWWAEVPGCRRDATHWMGGQLPLLRPTIKCLCGKTGFCTQLNRNDQVSMR